MRYIHFNAWRKHSFSYETWNGNHAINLWCRLRKQKIWSEDCQEKKKKTAGRREEKHRSKLRDQELQQVGKTKQILSWKIIWYWTDIKSRLVINEFVEIYEIKKNKIWSKKKKVNNAENNNDATINNIFT